MSFFLVDCRVAVGDDSSMTVVSFDRRCVAYQSKDRKVVQIDTVVLATDPEAQITFPTITTVYRWALFSDYPIKVRLTSSGTAMFTLTSSNVNPYNPGSPAPDQCVIHMPCAPGYLALAPIASAQQTANVHIVLEGDPLSSYV